MTTPFGQGVCESLQMGVLILSDRPRVDGLFLLLLLLSHEHSDRWGATCSWLYNMSDLMKTHSHLSRNMFCTNEPVSQSRGIVAYLVM